MKTIISSITPWLSLGLLGFVAFLSLRSYLIKPAVLFNRERVTEVNMDSVQHWKDEASREHAKRVVAEGTLTSLQYYYGPLMDSVTKSLNIQGKRLETITALSTQTKGRITLVTDTFYKEGVRLSHYSGTDGYLTLSGNSNDSFVDYLYKDSLITAAFWKKRPFFKGGMWGKQDLMVDAYSINPNSRINQLSTLKVAKNDFDRVTLDVYGGAENAAGPWQGVAGAAIRLNRTSRTSIEINGQYNYSPQLGLKPSYGAKVKFSLIKF